MLKNTLSEFGLIAKLLHLISAFIVIGLFILGYWMVDLTYYSSWYKDAPFIHKGIGIIFAGLLFFRIIWKLINPKPDELHPEQTLINKLAELGHLSLYVFMLIVVLSGYLISSADGQGINVFNLFSVPAPDTLLNFINDDNLADKAGFVHKYIAYALIAVSVIHVIAALHHHYVFKDTTLSRMFKFKQQ